MKLRAVNRFALDDKGASAARAALNPVDAVASALTHQYATTASIKVRAIKVQRWKSVHFRRIEGVRVTAALVGTFVGEVNEDCSDRLWLRGFGYRGMFR